MATRNALYDTPLKRGFIKSLLCLSVLGAIGSVHAQDTQPEDEETTEVIEVRGIRASSAENLAIKRLSNATVDAITAEDIGKFPDKNVADSLQRVPGVVIQRDGGEGATVSIRGLSSDLTFTQLNGNFIASSPGEHAFSFTLLFKDLLHHTLRSITLCATVNGLLINHLCIIKVLVENIDSRTLSSVDTVLLGIANKET